MEKIENDLNIYVLGNNYDGCLLTGDTKDVQNFKEIDQDLIELISNKHKLFKTGMKTCFLIDQGKKINNSR